MSERANASRVDCLFPETYKHFQRVALTQRVDVAPIAEYVSRLSGVRVLIASVERPLVDGVLLVPTEAHDDNGCAHALEHLVFLGSKRYPYYGVLDSIASRCLADGTNAWTETDHTAYTVTTAGYSGFLTILEVFLDHVLHPTLTEEGFITEVHHITEQGENSGVVYSEMSGAEYDSDVVVDRALRHGLYPEGCGYRYETGGRLENLRDEIDLEAIKAFHKKFYRWDNLAILVLGRVPVVELLNRISQVEMRDIPVSSSKGSFQQTTAVTDSMSRESTVAPWTSPVPETRWCGQSVHVRFPSEDPGDDQGEVVLGWRGPPWSEVRERYVLSILGDYLCSGNAAPLQKRFVNIPNPLASDVVFDERPFNEELNRGVSLERIHAVARRLLATIEQRWEDEPDEAFVQPLVEYVVNSPRPNASLMDTLWAVETTFHEDLLKQPQSYWTGRLANFFVTSSPYEVLGMPCRKLAKTLKNQQTRRIQQQLTSLRRQPGGVKGHAARLKAAKELHELRAPESFIATFPVADITSVHSFNFPCHANFALPWTATQRCSPSTPADTECLLPSPFEQLPVPLHYCHVPSKFFELRVFFRLPPQEDHPFAAPEDIPLIPLLLELLFELGADIARWTTPASSSSDAAMQNETHIVDHERFTQMLLDTTISHRAILGLDGAQPHAATYPEIVSVNLCCATDKLLNTATLLLIVLKDLQFTKERMVAVANSMLSSSLRQKRRSKSLAQAYHLGLRYPRSSFRMQMSLPAQHVILARLVKDPDRFLPKVKALYHQIFASPETRCFIQLVGARDKLCVVASELAALLAQVMPAGTTHATCGSVKGPRTRADGPFDSIPTYFQLASTSADKNPVGCALNSGNAMIAGCSSRDAGALLMSIPGALGHENPDAVDLFVLGELLSSSDGPLFTAVRGSGLAYSVSCYHSSFSGEFFLRLLDATDVATAFSLCLDVVRQLATWETAETLFHKLVESAKCTSLFHIVRQEATMAEYAAEKLLLLCLGLPADYNAKIIQQIMDISAERLARVAASYLSEFLVPWVSEDSYARGRAVVVVVNASDVQATNEKFRALGCWKLLTSDTATALCEMKWDKFAAWVLALPDTDHALDDLEGSTEEDDLSDETSSSSNC